VVVKLGVAAGPRNEADGSGKGDRGLTCRAGKVSVGDRGRSAASRIWRERLEMVRYLLCRG
jgi:hypothetical protein